MARVIRSPKDFWAGALYAGLGAAAVLMARDYGMGSGARMGPAYFPTVLGGLLFVVGAASIARSFVVRGEPVGAIAWKGLVLVTAGTLLFGVLLRPAGMIAAIAALVLVSAAASAKFRFERKALALMALLIAFCSLVFVRGLGMNVPLVGPWLGG